MDRFLLNFFPYWYQTEQPMKLSRKNPQLLKFLLLLFAKILIRIVNKTYILYSLKIKITLAL